MEGSHIQPDRGSQASLPARQGVLFEAPEAQSELALPVKTPEGQAEIRQRQRGLSQRQRTMLLLVDGRRSVAQLKHVASQAGATETCFDELLDLGLIRVVAPTSIAPAAARALPAPLAASSTVPPAPSQITLHAPDGTPPAAAAESQPTAAQSPAPLPSDLDDLSPVAAAPHFKEAVPAPSADAATPFLPMAPLQDSQPPAPLSDERMEMLAEVETSLPAPRPAKTGPGLVDSMMGSLYPLLESAFGALGGSDSQQPRDDALEEARRILVREIKTKAPVTGSITLMKLRRARTRDELAALFEEVDGHISKPMRHLSAQQTLLHVRGLLSGAPTESWHTRA